MILNPPHDLINDRKRDEKPRAGLDRVTEAIRDFDLEASGPRKPCSKFSSRDGFMPVSL
jgi:hypothetical protein